MKAAAATVGRRWSWTALITAIAIWALALPTWGLSELLTPVGVAFSVVAWRREPHDGVFWVGATLNGLNALGFLALVVSFLIGDIGIGFE